MCLRRSTARHLLVAVLLGAISACAQFVRELEPTKPVTPEEILAPVAGDSPTWEDAGRHIRIVADYDGSRVRVRSVVSGKGSARSYLSQRRDIVVVILDDARSVLKEFNLPDPRELRVGEQAPARPIDVDAPRTRDPLERRPIKLPRLGEPAAQSRESTIRVDRAQFEMFVPQLAGARLLVFRSGGAQGLLLGEVDLKGVK